MPGAMDSCWLIQEAWSSWWITEELVQRACCEEAKERQGCQPAVCLSFSL